jgi:hypothetical protein
MLSEADYYVKLEFLQDKDPLCPMLPKLRNGHSTINAMYLLECIKAIPVKVKPDPVTPAVAKTAATGLEIELRHHRQSRDELSNSFQSCITDADRARVSAAIIAINDKIKVLMDRLDHYQETKDVPELPKSDNYPVPDDDMELYKLNHALRTNILRVTKIINKLYQQQATANGVQLHKIQSRIADNEKKLSHHKIHKKYVEHETNRRKNT